MKKEEIPPPSELRLSGENPFYDEIIKRHEAACMKDEDIYEDPKTGLVVFTAYYHLKRGSCCNSGCRHCPYI